MPRIELNNGDRIEGTRLCYLEDVERVDSKRRRSKFICDCGKIFETDLHWVRFKNITSCGCFKTEELIKKNFKHGAASRVDKLGAYRSWQALNQRAGSKKNYEHVSVCERWQGVDGFKNFLLDMGDRPKDHSIERKDNSKGYSPENCKWATIKEQARNKSNIVNVTIDNETNCIAYWCEKFNIPYSLVKQRRQKGMALIDAITKPIDISKRNFRTKNSNNLEIPPVKPFLGLPPRENSFYEDSLRYELDTRLYMVFGSNLSGVHGAGAAKQALEEYGAVWGQGVGLAGQSYAIPTKDHHIRTLPLVEIKKYVDEFKEIILEQQDHYFFVTAIGTGLAGYSHAEIAPMFKGVMNCWLPSSWFKYLGN